MKSFVLKFCFSLIITCVYLNVVNGQIQISGIIKDSNSLQSIKDATILINNVATTISNKEGVFYTKANLNDTIKIIKFGYQDDFKVVNLVNSHIINFNLLPSTDNINFILFDYGLQNAVTSTSASVSLTESNFNKGIVSDPALLIQGKSTGIQVYNRGGNINQSSMNRIRGFNSLGLSQSEPLVIIDGIISASLQNVDPNDIDKIEIIKDGSGTSIYGIRGSAGVIYITTKSNTESGLKLNYRGQIGVLSPINHVKVMDSQTFRSAGGQDLGSNTDWMKEITQHRLSQTHHFSASNGFGKSHIRVSANIRNINGIILNSNLDLLNARLNFSTKALSDKLNIHFTSSITSKNQNYSFQEAIRYAIYFNPTAPEYGKDAPFAFNSPQFGGYFEQISLFDAFNPVSILNQNKNLGKTIESTLGLNLSYQILENLSINAKIAGQDSKFKGNQYYPSTAYFRGQASSPSRKGLVIFNDVQNKFQLYEFFASYTKKIGDYSIFCNAGYSFQQYNFYKQDFSLGDFPNNDIDYTNHIESSQDLQNAGYITGSTYASPDEKVIGMFAKINLNYKNIFFVNSSFRQDGSTKLGDNLKRNLFSSFGFGMNLHPYLPLNSLDLLKIRIGYGTTGGLPLQSGLAKEIRIINNGFDGSVHTQIVHYSNGGLKWEQKNEKNLGLDFSFGKISGSLDIFNKNINDIIQYTPGTKPVYENNSSINTKGLEFLVNYKLVNNANFGYNSGIIFSKYKSKLTSYIYDQELRANPGAPGQGSTLMIKVKNGEEIGQIWGRVFNGVDTNGDALFADVNGDGQLNVLQSQALDPIGDFKTLGYGLPKFELGWTNQLRYKNWTLDAFFRGAFGHSLVNTWRLFYEPRIPFQKNYNYVNTPLAINDLKTSRFSSLYVEKADFFKLDNVTISRSAQLSSSKLISDINISISGQNLFTMTKYTGPDPEPALQFLPPTDNGFIQNVNNPDLLSPGIDSRNDFLPSKTIVLSLHLTFR